MTLIGITTALALMAIVATCRRTIALQSYAGDATATGLGVAERTWYRQDTPADVAATGFALMGLSAALQTPAPVVAAVFKPRTRNLAAAVRATNWTLAPANNLQLDLFN